MLFDIFLRNVDTSERHRFLTTYQPPVNYSGPFDIASYDVALSVFDIQPRGCNRRQEKRVGNTVAELPSKMRVFFDVRKKQKIENSSIFIFLGRFKSRSR